MYFHLNTVRTKQASHVLSNKEYSISIFGLKSRLATHQKENNILVYPGDIWEEIDKSNIYCIKVYKKSKIQNALRTLTFNMSNLEDAYLFKDCNKI